MSEMPECKHDKYWVGIYGTCMVCRAEKAEAKAKLYEKALKVIDPPMNSSTCGCWEVARKALCDGGGYKPLTETIRQLGGK